MSDRTEKLISQEEVGLRKDEGEGRTAQDYLVTKIWYDKGGVNYFSGGSNLRGYYVAVKIETHHSNGMVGFELFTGGIRQFLTPAKRFSAKTLEEITVSWDVISKLREQVLEQYHKKKQAA